MFFSLGTGDHKNEFFSEANITSNYFLFLRTKLPVVPNIYTADVWIRKQSNNFVLGALFKYSTALTYLGVEVCLHAFITSILDRGSG